MPPSSLRRDGLYEAAYHHWCNFVRAYSFDSFPSPDSLSLFVVFRLRSIAASSVEKELAGIGWHYKGVDEPRWTGARSSPEVARALLGGIKTLQQPVHQAAPLPMDILVRAIDRLRLPHAPYEALLWAAMAIVGFLTCSRAQEVSTFDSPALRNTAKLIPRSSVGLDDHGFVAFLPYHKADRRFAGTRLHFAAADIGDFMYVLALYLRVRDHVHGLAGPLFRRLDGSAPTRRWFVDELKTRCGSSFTGHSLRAGGASWYASRGMAGEDIRRIGHWSSDRWATYVRLHPEVANALRNDSVAHRPPPAPPALRLDDILPLVRPS